MDEKKVTLGDALKSLSEEQAGTITRICGDIIIIFQELDQYQKAVIAFIIMATVKEFMKDGDKDPLQKTLDFMQKELLNPPS